MGLVPLYLCTFLLCTFSPAAPPYIPSATAPATTKHQIINPISYGHSLSQTTASPQTPPSNRITTTASLLSLPLSQLTRYKRTHTWSLANHNAQCHTLKRAKNGSTSPSLSLRPGPPRQVLPLSFSTSNLPSPNDSPHLHP